MSRINIPQTYKNAPKFQKVIAFYQALFESSEDRVMQMVSDDIKYVLHGALDYEGKAGILQMMKDMSESGIERVDVEHIISDGEYAAANGILRLKDGITMAFCEVMTFQDDGKVRRMDSYVVPMSGSANEHAL